VTVLSAQELTTSSDCRFASCTDEALPGDSYCAYHRTTARSLVRVCRVPGCDQDASDAPTMGRYGPVHAALVEWRNICHGLAGDAPQ
jgi:hypothetical protein